MLEHKTIKISTKYDEVGLYLLLEKSGLTASDILHIPIDVCPKVGSMVCQEPNLTFERQADFILRISGADNSCLLVNERYDSTRQQFYFNMTGGDPFVAIPDIDSSEFIPVYMALENPLLLDNLTPEARAAQRLKKYETGRLLQGDSSNSLTDFCYGTDMVEIRLPWMMLNFYDPSRMQVHDDYYENFGVEGLSINQIYLGVAEDASNETIPMKPLKLKGWGNVVTYHERLKDSYYILKQNWSDNHKN